MRVAMLGIISGDPQLGAKYVDEAEGAPKTLGAAAFCAEVKTNVDKLKQDFASRGS